MKRDRKIEPMTIFGALMLVGHSKICHAQRKIYKVEQPNDGKIR
jgi:hypothetical protein